MAEVKEKSTAIKMIDCSCASAYQDEKYGKGKRAHNPCTKGHRCTVCGKEKIK